MSQVLPLQPVPAAVEGRPLGWWGIMTTVVTEGLLFALLLFSYFYLRAGAGEWPLGGIAKPELMTTGVRSLLLFASSATISWGERGLRRGNQRRLQIGLVATIVLAIVFLAGHVVEMIELPAEFTWRTNAYGSLYYTITNFHAAHLVIGLVMLSFGLVAARRGLYRPDRHLGLQVVSIYWHFVDVVWVFVFASLYLVPHLLD